MPTTRVNREVSLDEAEQALSSALGPRYQVRRKTASTLVARRNGLVGAAVRMSSAGGTTTFKVSGTGLIFNRLYNQFSVARQVSDALGRALTNTAS